MVDVLFAREPELARKYFSADRGLDSGPLKKKFWVRWRIRPIIDNRELWREEKKGQRYVEGQKIMRPLVSVHDNIFYTERAEIWCRCPVRNARWRFAALNPSDAVKFHCPAAEYGLNCEGWKKC